MARAMVTVTVTAVVLRTRALRSASGATASSIFLTSGCSGRWALPTRRGPPSFLSCTCACLRLRSRTCLCSYALFHACVHARVHAPRNTLQVGCTVLALTSLCICGRGVSWIIWFGLARYMYTQAASCLFFFLFPLLSTVSTLLRTPALSGALPSLYPSPPPSPHFRASDMTWGRSWATYYSFLSDVTGRSQWSRQGGTDDA